eukprot:scaffold115378_cov17-Tisochrysis_lutea.AAC.1
MALLQPSFTPGCVAKRLKYATGFRCVILASADQKSKELKAQLKTSSLQLLLDRSAEILNTSLDNGGGNRVSEEQIKNYLRKTLGEEAPQPEWGLPEGWGQYLSGVCLGWHASAMPCACAHASACMCQVCLDMLGYLLTCSCDAVPGHAFPCTNCTSSHTQQLKKGMQRGTENVFFVLVLGAPGSLHFHLLHANDSAHILICAELLCWALDRPITREQAMGCARRQQGRSWEIVESAVRDLGE